MLVNISIRENNIPALQAVFTTSLQILVNSNKLKLSFQNGVYNEIS